MRVLCIESSSPEGSIAVLDGGRLLESWEFACPRGRGSELFAALQSAAELAGKPDAVVVGTGPGGYNGLRMSAAAGWGIARAQGARLQGISSLLGYDAPDYYVAGDARGGQWFLARVTGGKIAFGPELVSPVAALISIVPDVPVFAPAGIPLGLERAIRKAPSAGVLGCQERAFGRAEPSYLKPPHITGPKGS